MSIPISTIVNVNVAMPPTFPAGSGFSTLMVLGQSDYLPLSVRAVAFDSVQAVGRQFSSSSEEYKASLTFFSQNPRPPFMVIGRRVAGPAGGELLGSGNYESDLSKWRVLPGSETLSLTVDGTPLTLQGMNFSQVANLNGVAAVLNEALLNPIRGSNTLRVGLSDTDTEVGLLTPSTTQIGDSLRIGNEFMTVVTVTDPQNLVVQRGQRGSTAVGHAVGAPVFIGVSGVATATLTFTGSQFFVQSGSSGATSTVAVSTPSNLSRMLGFGDGANSTPGVAAREDLATALDACEAVTNFYGIVLTREFSDSDAMEAATWTEAHSKLFGHASGDQNSKVATSTSDFPAQCQQKAFTRTLSAYNDPAGLSDYLMASALARELAVDFSQPDSTITLMFKQMPGVTPSNINRNDAAVLDGKYSNYYAFFGAVPMFATGRMASGAWLDQRHGLDFLGQHLADAAFGGLLTAPKIPQTDRGMTYLTGLLEVAMQDMVRCGLIAPGYWRSTGISGVVNTGEFLDKGYRIVAASIASQSEIDRQARKAPPVTIACKGAGALHSIDIYVQFEP